MIDPSSAAPGGSDPAEDEAARWLLSAPAVRERSEALFTTVEDGRSEFFTYAPEAMPGIAGRVAALTAHRFPALAVPLHSRWRHFEAGGIERFKSLADAREWSGREEAARAMGDLAIVSVLLDAGAGPGWRYREAATGQSAGRSEGLALASFAMFASGAFSSVPADPLRVDAEALAALQEEEFARGFQISEENPLDGAEGRLALLAALARATRERADLFASQDDPRPGGIVDALAARSEGGALAAPVILSLLLEGLGPIWPGRQTLAGRPLGDTWPHPALGDGSPGSDLVPFHKLSLWLSLSLVEPLTMRGIDVTDLDALPGLAEYRNGGLFVDGGALKPVGVGHEPLPVGHPAIVEWRAATVTLLDRLAPLVRERLGAGPDALPLASILEGGTWLAGRELARELRPSGGPPIAFASDGTVF
jgi:hypothetical protein